MISAKKSLQKRNNIPPGGFVSAISGNPFSWFISMKVKE
jgi:hypothetical protein